MKKYFLEYRDKGGYTCGEEVKAKNQNHAVTLVQLDLIKENDYMSELRDIKEVVIENNK